MNSISCSIELANRIRLLRTEPIADFKEATEEPYPPYRFTRAAKLDQVADYMLVTSTLGSNQRITQKFQPENLLLGQFGGPYQLESRVRWTSCSVETLVECSAYPGCTPGCTGRLFPLKW
jgi:hypothetical protein